MAARVLDVGNCDPDHFSIRSMLVRHFDVEVDRVMFVSEAEVAISRRTYDLVLVNRRIFADDSDGLTLVRSIAALPDDRPAVMLISNFPDAQDAAVEAGAERGFGKAGLTDPRTIDRLAAILPPRAAEARG